LTKKIRFEILKLKKELTWNKSWNHWSRHDDYDDNDLLWNGSNHVVHDY